MEKWWLSIMPTLGLELKLSIINKSPERKPFSHQWPHPNTHTHKHTNTHTHSPCTITGKVTEVVNPLTDNVRVKLVPFWKFWPTSTRNTLKKIYKQRQFSNKMVILCQSRFNAKGWLALTVLDCHNYYQWIIVTIILIMWTAPSAIAQVHPNTLPLLCYKPDNWS